MGKRVTYDDAVKRALKAGFEPAFPRDEWQGTSVNGKRAKYPWTHLKCGETRWQRFDNMLTGHCGGCNPTEVSYDEAVERALEAGFKPAFSREDWQGTWVNGKHVKYPWTHLEPDCGETRWQEFHNMLKGKCSGCNPKEVTYDDAVKRAREAGFEAAFPRGEWKGASVNGKRAKYPWTHLKCGETRWQRFDNMLTGHCGGCNPTEVSYDEAVERALEAGFKPAFSREDWQGTRVNGKHVKCPWTHLEPDCGETRWQEFHNMLKGKCSGCGQCDNTGPSTVYVVWHSEWKVGKYGKANESKQSLASLRKGRKRATERLSQHTRVGFQVYGVVPVSTGDKALEIEDEVERIIREEWGIPDAADRCPKKVTRSDWAGRTETWALEDLDPARVWELLLKVATDAGEDTQENQAHLFAM
jgi:Fe-S cluster biogenesis protein NfuA